jgi:hypothetical protein
MTLPTWAIALSLVVPAAAFAQPTAPVGPQPDPAAPPVTPATPPSTPPPGAVAAADPAVATPGRPSEIGFGIGVGYVFPTSLQTPNTTSVRLRLPTGLTFEPQLVLATTASDVAAGGTSRQHEITLGTLVRYPLRVRGSFDLEAIGSATIAVRAVDPANDNNTRTTSSFNLGYGVGIGYWLTAHWCVSLTASNPLVSLARTRQETGPGASTVSDTSTIGLVFEPLVTAMIHLYH